MFPLVSVRPEWRLGSSGVAVYGNRRMNLWITEPQILYNKIIGKGKLEGLLGGTFQQNTSEGSIINGSGYSSDLALQDMKSAANLFVLSSLASTYKYAAVFGRLNYLWKDRYIINLTARRDGSSRFGADNRFDNFLAAGAAWIFTEEKIFNKTAEFLSFGKLRGRLRYNR